MTLSHAPAAPIRALIVIDPHTFKTDDSAIVANINRLLAERWDYVVFTSDRNEPWHPDLRQCVVADQKEFRIYKDRRLQMPCFSAFDGVGGCDNDVTLEMMLKGHGVMDVTICGLCHEIGIQTTAQDAAKLGFRTTVVQKACRLYASAAELLEARGVTLRV
jgi:nicotinamidase-related amidase